MKPKIIFAAFLSVFAALLLIQCNSPISMEEPPTGKPGPEPDPDEEETEFIYADDTGTFIADGESFRFAGTNAYYLPNYEKLDPDFVDRTLDVFQETGISVIRTWAFYDGFDCGYSQYDPNESVIQTAPGEYNEEALQALDRLIAKGKERGIRFLMPFVNFWDDLGGVCQYNTWAGAENPGSNMEFFLNNPDIQKWFKDYISMLLNRENTVTGVAYKDEPAIFAWQIINEARNFGADPQILRNWYQEMAVFIKSIDKNHMVSTGEEGLDYGTPPQYSEDQYSNTYVIRADAGTSFILNASIPEIDFVSAHWYPLEQGFREATYKELLMAQHAWLTDHQKIAESINKPFIIGEYGAHSSENKNIPHQELYFDFWDYSLQLGLGGSFIWQLVIDSIKCTEVGSNICWPGGRRDQMMYSAFKDHIKTVQAENGNAN